jgi:hypothetical protein
MDGVRRIAPIFPVSNLAQALEHYARLGFNTRTYEGGGYRYVSRDGVEIHRAVVPARASPRLSTPTGASTKAATSTRTATSSGSARR